jgi:hypothetical protein
VESLVPSFVEALQPFREAMTSPTFANLLVVAFGWVMCRRRTVTGAVAADLAAGLAVPRHRSAYHRVFAAGRWSLDAVGLGVLRAAAALAGATVFLAVDDTLCRRWGRRVYGAGMHYDPLATGRAWSNAGRSVKSRGHCWVALGVVVSLPGRPAHRWCLPVLFRLYLNHRSADAHGVAHRTKPQLAQELVALACAAMPARRFHLLADSGYATGELLNALPANCDLTGRWVANAALYAPAPARAAGRRGRPRVRGGRLPGPAQMLAGRCRRLAADAFGLRGSYRVASCLACLYDAPRRLLTVVVAEPTARSGQPAAGARRAVTFSTVTDAAADQVLLWYAMRWSIEVTFRDAKQHMGLEHLYGWSEQAARRTAPTLMLLCGLVVLWSAAAGQRPAPSPATPPTFAGMLAGLRDATARSAVLGDPPAGRVAEKPVESLLALLRLAT